MKVLGNGSISAPQIDYGIVKASVLTGKGKISLTGKCREAEHHKHSCHRTDHCDTNPFQPFVDGLVYGFMPVSYTHLDVYKRQGIPCKSWKGNKYGVEERYAYCQMYGQPQAD